MKTVHVWFGLLFALPCLLQGQAQVAGGSELPYIDHQPVKTANAPEQPGANIRSAKRPAYFSGAEASLKLMVDVSVEDDVLAAYQAISAARARIQSDRSCQRFFHAEGEQVLERTRFTMQYLRVRTIAAQVEGSVVVLNRDPNGPFLKPEAFAGMTDFTEIRAFFILHGLAHELSRHTRYLVDHTSSPVANALRTKLNNALLLQNCYRTSHAMVAAR
jgi:hypothetical protein